MHRLLKRFSASARSPAAARADGPTDFVPVARAELLALAVTVLLLLVGMRWGFRPAWARDDPALCRVYLGGHDGLLLPYTRTRGPRRRGPRWCGPASTPC